MEERSKDERSKDERSELKRKLESMQKRKRTHGSYILMSCQISS
jgi:hypothetical protein